MARTALMRTTLRDLTPAQLTPLHMLCAPTSPRLLPLTPPSGPLVYACFRMFWIRVQFKQRSQMGRSHPGGHEGLGSMPAASARVHAPSRKGGSSGMRRIGKGGKVYREHALS